MPGRVHRDRAPALPAQGHIAVHAARLEQLARYRELGFNKVCLRLFYPGMSEQEVLDHIRLPETRVLRRVGLPRARRVGGQGRPARTAQSLTRKRVERQYGAGRKTPPSRTRRSSPSPSSAAHTATCDDRPPRKARKTPSSPIRPQIAHMVRQVPLRQPIPHIRRQQQPLIRLVRAKRRRHRNLLLTATQLSHSTSYGAGS